MRTAATVAGGLAELVLRVVTVVAGFGGFVTAVAGVGLVLVAGSLVAGVVLLVVGAAGMAAAWWLSSVTPI